MWFVASTSQTPSSQADCACGRIFCARSLIGITIKTLMSISRTVRRQLGCISVGLTFTAHYNSFWLTTLEDHCIEMLRQFVMCHADVGIVTSHWVEGRSRPYPDFSTAHRCRNFDVIHEWTEAHKAPPLTHPPAGKPDGVKALSSPP